MQKLRKISPFRLSSLLRLENDPRQALKLFLNPNPDDSNPKKPFRYSLLSYDLIISKLGRAKLFQEMEQVVEKLKIDSRITPTEIIYCNIMKFYGRGRMIDRALQLFDEMPEYRCPRTIKSVNTLLSCFAQHEEFDKMWKLLSGVEKYNLKWDRCTYNILINTSCSRGNMRTALEAFDEMQKRGLVPNVVTFGTLINGFCGVFDLASAFELKEKMEREFKITGLSCVYVPLIKGVCRLGDLDKGIELKNEMLSNCMAMDSAVYSTLISAFFKFDMPDKVQALLEEMKRIKCKPDTATYNAMIHGFCLKKKFESGFRVLNEMEKEGCKPDVISFNVIIGALCREKRVREACELLEDMPRRKCRPDVVSYRLVFEGLCDAKEFKEAASVLDEMIFKRYVSYHSNVSKSLDRLIREKGKEVFTFTFGLAKIDLADRYIWRMVTSLVLCNENQSDANELLDSLIKSRFPSTG